MSHTETPIPTGEALARLTDADVAAWVQRALIERTKASPWSLRRWRWRRASQTATRLLGQRLMADGASQGGECTRCRQAPAIRHSVYGEGAKLRFAHHCATCAAAIPPGWFGAATAQPG